MSWGLQSLQAVWWVLKPLQATPADIFQTVVGGTPNSTQTVGGITVVTGSAPGKIYRIQHQGNRLDFFMNPADASHIQFPLFTDIDGAFLDFSSKIDSASPLIGDVNRLALVANVSELATSSGNAAASAANLIGIQIPFSDSTDFIFQINRRMTSPSIPTLFLNRVIKWMGEHYQLFELASGTPAVREVDVTTVSVDVNVVPIPNLVLNPQQQSAIFKDLATEATRLCAARNIAALS
jgi:hypothetical protein